MIRSHRVRSRHSGNSRPVPSFRADLDGTLNPSPAHGSNVASFARDDIKTGIDEQGKQFTAKANESVFEGSLRVENLIVASEDMTNAAYTADGGATVDSATQVTFDGSGNSGIFQQKNNTDDGSGAGGRTWVFSAEIALVSGSISADNAVIMQIIGDAVSNSAINIGSEITATPQRFSVAASTDAAGTTKFAEVEVDDAVTLSITNWQLEEVTGQLNQSAPGEYVSTGVGTGAEEVNTMVAANWIAQGNNTVTDIGTDEVAITYVDDAGGADIRMRSGTGIEMTDDPVIGKDYVISGQAKVNTGSVNIRIVGAVTSDLWPISSTTFVDFAITSTCQSITDFRTDMTGFSAGEILNVRNLSVKEADHGANRDGVKYFPYHNGNTVTDGVVTEANGPAINSSNSQFVELDGVSGTYVSTPDSAASSVTGALTLIVWMALDDWTPSSLTIPIAKSLGTGDQRSYQFRVNTDGTIALGATAGGAGITTASSTAATGFAAGTGHWVRITFSTAGTVNFYTSDQPLGASISSLSWVQLGDADVSLAIASIFDSTANTTIGGANDGTASLFAGKVSRAVVIASTDPTATPAVDFNANDYVAGQTFESSSTGEVYTLNGAAKVFTPLSQSIDVDGSADGWTSPDSVASSITGDIFLAGWGAPDDWTPAANAFIIGKYELTGDEVSYALGIETTGLVRLVTSNDGTSAAIVASNSDVATGFTDGTLNGFGVALDISANTATFYTAPASDAFKPHNKVTWTQLGDPVAHVESAIYDGTALVTIGALQDGVQTNEWTGRIMRAYAIASTDPTVAPAWDFDARALTPGVTTGTMSTGEVWTAVGNGTIEAQIPAKWDAKGSYGINIEGARTNEFLYSTPADLGTTWVPNSNAVLTANYARARDGSKTAVRLIDDVGGGTGNVIMSTIGTTVTSGDNVFSADIYPDQLEWVLLRQQNFDTNGQCYFDVKNGVIGTKTAGAETVGMEPIGNGGYRCWIQFSTTTDLTGDCYIFVASADAGATVDLDGTSSIIVSNIQLEAGTFPSTYIPTTTTAVTRNADVLTYSAAGNADSYPLTMSVDYVQPNIFASTSIVLSLDDASTTDRAQFGVTAGLPNYFVRSSSSTQANLDYSGTVLAGVSATLTATIATNDFEAYLDGASEGVDTSGVPPVGLTTIHVGAAFDGSAQPYANIRNVKIYKSRLNDTTIATL